MNAEQPYPDPITDDQLQHFLARAKVQNDCPVCGTNRWHRLAESSAGNDFAVPNFLPVRGPSGLEVVVLYCMHCGFVRLHAAHLIRARRAEV